MYPKSTGEHIEYLIDEYRTIASKVDEPGDRGKIQKLLSSDAEWTREGAAAILHLAHEYGSFVLANAFALAEALEIEDGESGI